MDGQLSVAELISRTESVHQSATLGDIRAALADVARPGDGSVSSPRRASRAVIDILSFGATLFAQAVGSRVLTIAAVGEMTIDFRRVAVASGTTTITAIAFLGEIRIIIPATMRYHQDWALAFLGRASAAVQDPPASTGPLIPLIRVRPIGILGNVLVQRVPCRNAGPQAETCPKRARSTQAPAAALNDITMISSRSRRHLPGKVCSHGCREASGM